MDEQSAMHRWNYSHWMSIQAVAWDGGIARVLQSDTIISPASAAGNIKVEIILVPANLIFRFNARSMLN